MKKTDHYWLLRKGFFKTKVVLGKTWIDIAQKEIKEVLGEEYQDYRLIMAISYGLPVSGSFVRKGLKKLIEEHNLPPVVFYSIRHTSVSYKLKLNGGDIKAVQGEFRSCPGQYDYRCLFSYHR